MAYRVHIVALAAVTVFAATGYAGAADYIPDTPVIIEQPVIEYSPPPYYTRFDCAVALHDEADLRAGSPQRHFIAKNGGRIETDNGWSCDVGLGYHVTNSIRVDATVEYRGEFDINGIADPTYIDPLSGPPPNPTSQATSVDSIVTLFNAYWDIDTYHGVTPYVGGGIGFAYNEIEDTYVAEGNGFFTNGDNSTDFAWALMAGLGIDISPDVVLDAGYRYVNFGDVETSTVGSDGSSVPVVKVVDMDAHEIRVGVRYSFY